MLKARVLSAVEVNSLTALGEHWVQGGVQPSAHKQHLHRDDRIVTHGSLPDRKDALSTSFTNFIARSLMRVDC